MIKKVALALILLVFATQAHAQLVPYFGKNNVKYDTFDWKTYKTEHFEIFFYPQEEEHLQRVASMAESAYDKLSALLQHDVEFKIPLIYFKTSSEFEQVNYLQVEEGVLGVAEPEFNRMAFTIDVAPDMLYGLITHELTHVFEFSMLFGGILSPIVRSSPPGWVMEGFAEYGRGVWDPGDLMVVRDAVLTEKMPFVSVTNDLIFPGGIQLGRMNYNVGHATFDFIRDRYGDAAIRQFWFYLKKATLLGQEDVIYSALGIKEEAFNEQLSQYLRDKFKDYRDKQSPVDYGKEVKLPQKYFQTFSQAPSPDGKEFAVLTANRDDYEFDIVIIDATGKVMHNITGGSTTSYQYLTTDSWTFEGRNISWSSDGQRLCYFARTGKRRSLFIVNADSGDRIKKIKLQVDQAASPSLSPDGHNVLFVGWESGEPGMFMINVDTEKVAKLTSDLLAEMTPMWSSDGKYIFYTARIHAHDQIMRMNSTNPKDVQQMTNSTYDSVAPYYDPQTNSIFYAADKGGAYNLYKLDLNTGDKTQYSDVIGGNFSPVLFRQDGKEKIAFTTYFKAEYRLFIMDLPKPIQVIAKGSEEVDEQGVQIAQEVYGPATQAPNVTGNVPPNPTETRAPRLSDFQPTKQLSIDQAKIQDKKFRLLVAGRPNVITGVSGDTFAIASGLVLQDIMGDQEFQFFVSRIRGFQSYQVGYLDLRRRFQYLTQFIFNDDFFYGPLPGGVADQFGFTSDVVRRRIYGGNIISQYPLSVFYRFEFGAGVYHINESFFDPVIQNAYENYLHRNNLDDPLAVGNYLPLTLAFVGETTRFREFGPLSGYTFRISSEISPPLGSNSVSRRVYDADFRKYFRVSNRSLVAGRGRAFYSDGNDPLILSYGGGQDVRGFTFREISGNKGGIANLEYRFPLFPNPRTPFLGQMRGRVFLDYFRASFILAGPGYQSLRFIYRTVANQPFVIDSAKGAGSVGGGFSVFAGGLPFNFDFSKVYGYGYLYGPGLTPINSTPERKFVDGVHFDFSIGYDF